MPREEAYPETRGSRPDTIRPPKSEMRMHACDPTRTLTTRRWRPRWATAALLACFVTSGTPQANALPSVSVTYLLRAITTQLTFRSRDSGSSVRCLGFVVTVRDSDAYVAAARPCLEPLLDTPLATGEPFGRLGVDITVVYADGSAGTVGGLAWMGDTLSLVASFVKRPESYNKLCPSCSMYADFGSEQTIPVALAPDAPTRATVPHGVVVSDADGGYGLRLGDMSGLLGSAVIDSRNGDLVGMLTVPREAGDAGQDHVRLSVGKAVNDLTGYAVAMFGR